MRVSFLLAILLALVATILALVLEGEPDAPLGHAHPTFDEMRQGGSGADRHGGRLGATFGVAALMVAFFVGLMALGARRPGRPGPGRWFAVGFVVQLAAVLALWLAYRRDLDATAPTMVFGFPAATAAMLLLVWPAPLWFVVLYVVGFDRWVLSEAELDAFRRRVREVAGESR